MCQGVLEPFLGDHRAALQCWGGPRAALPLASGSVQRFVLDLTAPIIAGHCQSDHSCVDALYDKNQTKS